MKAIQLLHFVLHFSSIFPALTFTYHVSLGATSLEIGEKKQEGAHTRSLFELVALDDESEKGRVLHFLDCLNNVKTTTEDELIDWYCDNKEQVVCCLPRRFVHDHDLLHRGVGILLMRKPNDVFVHMRSKNKRTWPGLLDSMIGGLRVSGTSSVTTLIKELKEELNLDINSEPHPTVKFLGTNTIYTEQNRCIVDNFIVTLADGDEERRLHFRDGEVEWGRWVALSELIDLIEKDETAFVPSGLQCFRYVHKLLL